MFRISDDVKSFFTNYSLLALSMDGRGYSAEVKGVKSLLIGTFLNKTFLKNSVKSN